MERILLGKTDLEVSRVGLGCEPLGGHDWGYIDEKEVEAAVIEAYDRGINVFDTADVYGLGRSEEKLSKILGSRLRDTVVVTKGGVGWETDLPGSRSRTFIDLKADHIVKSLEGSLRRLKLDCIPVYLLH